MPTRKTTNQGRIKRLPKITVRGTLRMTPEERSEAVRRSWVTRKASMEAAAKKREELARRRRERRQLKTGEESGSNPSLAT